METLEIIQYVLCAISGTLIGAVVTFGIYLTVTGEKSITIKW